MNFPSSSPKRRTNASLCTLRTLKTLRTLSLLVGMAAMSVTAVFAQEGRPAVATGHGLGNWVRHSAGGEVFLKVKQGTPMMVFERVRQCYRIVLADGTQGWMAYRTIGFNGANGSVVAAEGEPAVAAPPVAEHAVVVGVPAVSPVVGSPVVVEKSVAPVAHAVIPNHEQNIVRVVHTGKHQKWVAARAAKSHGGPSANHSKLVSVIRSHHR